MVTLQSAVTVMAEILAGHEPPLRQLLEEAGKDAARNALAPFGELPNVHFARFFIMDTTTDRQGRQYSARLIFLADVDGPADAFIQALCDLAGAGLDTIYAHCRGYPGRARLREFLRGHSIPVAAKYVNTIGRTVQQIRHESALREAIQEFLDLDSGNGNARGKWSGADPRRVRAAIQEFIEREPTLAWARQPVPPPEPSYILGEKVHFFLVAAVGVVLFPGIVLGLPVYLALLRWHETHDTACDVIPDDALIQALAAQEDHGVQNPYVSAGFVKPGPFRRFTESVVLWGANFLTRHVFNHANLIGVKTIHFARWIFIDQKQRLIFASNYDGSLENYMDDFVDKIAWALNIAFSSGVDYPKTNWLIFDGAHDELTFKRVNLTHQLVSPFWYAGYQGLTALNIDNNAEIRAGLFGAMDEAAATAWLRRL
jgi:hypothetical protein